MPVPNWYILLVHRKAYFVHICLIQECGSYRKVVYKSHGLCAIFQLFGAASIQVRLLFEDG